MNTVCASAPSLNLHTWIGTQGLTLTQLHFYSRLFLVREETSASLMYSTALCLSACQAHLLDTEPLPQVLLDVAIGQSANQKLDFLST